MKQGMIQLGIHISDQSLSLVAVAPAEMGYRIVAWQRNSLEADLVNGGRIQDVQKIATPIMKFVRRHKLCVGGTSLSLTLNVARLKVSSFQAGSDEALHEKVTQELQRYSPYGRDNTYGTYLVLPHADVGDGQASVLEVMTSQVAGDSCLAVAQRAGLKQPLLEAALWPLVRVLSQRGMVPEEEVSLLCTFDADAGMLCVLRGHHLIYCQNLSLGTEALVHDRQCLETLQQIGAPVIEYARTLSEKSLTLFVTGNCAYDELRTVVMRLRHSWRSVTLKQLTSVQLAKLFGLPSASDNCEVPILPLSSALSALEPHRHLDALNLILPSSLEKVSARREMSRMGKAIVAVVLLVVVAIVPVNKKIQDVQADSAQVESQVEHARPIQEQVQATHQKIEAARHAIRAYETGLASVVGRPWHRLLAVLVDHAPAGLRVKELATRKDGQFTLKGEAQAESVVHQFAQALQEDPLIDDVEVEQVQYHQGRSSTVEYRMVAFLVLMEPSGP